MLKTNADKLVMQSVQGTVSPPGGMTSVTWDKRFVTYPAVGAITYGLEIGDCCMGLMGEHVEPGVSTKIIDNPSFNSGYCILAQIGNTVRVVTGDAKGAIGYVTGKHAGCEHLMVYFDQETLEKLNHDDKFLVKAFGRGLKLTDYPDVDILNLDPDLLQKMNIREENGKLIVPVAKKIPSYLLGSGVGYPPTTRGDYDLVTTDKATMEKLGYNDLRYGDIVLMEDCDNGYGRGYHKGAATIGIVIHGDSYLMGHGPGITTLMSSRLPIIEGEIDERANLAYYLGTKE